MMVKISYCVLGYDSTSFGSKWVFDSYQTAKHHISEKTTICLGFTVQFLSIQNSCSYVQRLILCSVYTGFSAVIVCTVPMYTMYRVAFIIPAGKQKMSMGMMQWHWPHHECFAWC
jgi:hypothetical protein